MAKIGVSIVEDIGEIREGLERVIAGSQHFRLVSSYDEAETALIELPQLRPDIVIVDIQLPGISGIDCVRKVAAICPQMQFVMFTIYEDSEQVFEALAAGATGYLLKQTAPDKVLEALQDLYEGGSPMSASIARRVVSSFRTAQPANDALQMLSGRELEILNLLSKGLLYKEIAERLSISTGTVRKHLQNIYRKLQVQNKVEAINRAFGK